MQQLDPNFSSYFFDLWLDLLCVARVDGYFKFINPAWETTFGYSRDEFLSQSFLDLIHVDDLKATFDELEKLNSGLKTLHFENRFRTKDGDWIWLSWKANPQKDGTIYAVARNINEQKAQQLATKELLEQLQKSNQELDQFAYIVSHDLKSPLRGINSLAEWIEEDLGPDIPEEVKKHFKMLKQRVGLMQRLINDLLVYARTGRQNQVEITFNLSETIEEIRQNIHLPEGFQLLVQEKLPKIFGVKIEFFQVFFNLIGNAIKYRKSDSGKVEIGSKKLPDGHLIWVKDDGIGIEPRFHDKIFDVFQRLDASQAVEGTGIGLSIVKKIVEARGGKISLISDLGEGAEFQLFIPEKSKTSTSKKLQKDPA